MTNRRKFLALAGGGVVLAATGIGGWAATRDPKAARAPWGAAGGAADDARRYALSYAVLAPNPHNRQPWVADLSVPGEVLLTCDLDRRLPHTDPFDRQVTIGLGCFSELLVIAAAQAGYRVTAEFFPQGEPQPRLDARPVARFRFVEDASVTPDPLFANALVRRTNREPFDTGRSVAPDAIAAILAAARQARGEASVEPAKVLELRDLAWRAMEVELRTYRTAKESVDLLRIGRAEIEANPDGIALPGPMLEALDAVGLMSREAMLDTSSSVFRQQLAAMKPGFDTAMGFVWLATPGNSRADQIAAGRDYIRLNLAATAAGIAMQPLSQALQEYAEMRDLYAQIRDSLAVGEGETLQMFARIGYGPEIKASPRWPYETRLAGT